MSALLQKLRNPDLWLMAAALLYTLPSLGYPFVSDHAAQYYIGHAWAQGLIPYLDAWDNKAPGMFAIHALNVLILGEGMVPIRIIDALTVVAVGFGIARMARRGQESVPGQLGTTAFLFVAVYYSTLTFTDAAQAESWESALLLGSFALARRPSAPSWQTFSAGLLGGMAILFKPPALLVCGAIGWLYFRRWLDVPHDSDLRRSALLDFSLYVIGGSMAGVATLGYFAAVGALEPLLNWALHFLPAYASSFRKPELLLSSLLDYVGIFGAWLLVLIPLGVLGLRAAFQTPAEDEDRRLISSTLLLVGAAYASILLQMTFAPYHFVILLPFLMIPVAVGVRELARRKPVLLWAVNAAALLFASVAAPAWVESEYVSYSYPEHAVALASYSSGRIDRIEYLESFEQPSESIIDQEALALELRELAASEDRVFVAGYHPLIHTASGVPSMDRFPHGLWEVPGEHSPFFAEWMADRHRRFREDPPRFAVIVEGYEEELVLLEAAGYRETHRVEDLILFVLDRD